jgi:hypothetical protein
MTNLPLLGPGRRFSGLKKPLASHHSYHADSTAFGE